MRAAVDWCILNETKQLALAELPEQFKIKWHRQSIAKGYLKRVNKSKATGGDTWKPGGIYLKMLNCGINDEYTIKYSDPLTINSISNAISKGNVTCRQMSDYLCIRLTTVFRALTNYHDAGELERRSVRNVYHYSI